jgi:Holliday junction resolvasome RuvABC endonuclease subunit
MKPKIGALDLSLRGLGMVAVPHDWDLRWERVQFKTLSYPLKRTATTREEVARLIALSNDVCRWLEAVEVTEVWCEHISSHQGFQVVQLSELRAAVRLEVSRRLGLDVQFAPEMTARKTLLGWVPGKDRKAHVVEALKAAGDPFECDERDAFTIANLRLHELGAPCLTGLLGEKPAKPKKPSKRKPFANGSEMVART